MYLETVDFGKLNNHAVCFWEHPNLNDVKKKNICSIGGIFSRVPGLPISIEEDELDRLSY